MLRRATFSGFSLIELLVSIVIFSVGLLAIAGLQTVSKRANYESLQRTTASQVANGLLEDMRMNGDGMNVYLAAPDLGAGAIAAEPLPSCSPATGPCNPAQKALHDLWFWEGMVDGNYEVGDDGATGGILMPTICIDGPAGGGPGAYIVTVAWFGSVSLQDDGANTCGAGSGKYGSGNEFRRSVQLPTFIDPSL